MRLLLFLAIASGCSAAALPGPQTTASPPIVSPLSFQCVWHFTTPNDTSDSDQSPSVAACDADHFSLGDAMLIVDATRNGIATVAGCRADVHSAGSGESDWFLGVSGCGVDGLVGVNLR